jgi:hypothetical protein
MNTDFREPQAMILFARVNMPIFLESLGTARRTRVSHDHGC